MKKNGISFTNSDSGTYYLFNSDKKYYISIFKDAKNYSDINGALGVYMIGLFNNQESKCFYVGRSKNMYRRLKNKYHPFYLIKKQYPDITIKYFNTKNYKDLERHMINLYRPPYNSIMCLEK